MPNQRHAPVFLGVLLVVIGLAIGVGGVWLIALGGSWYYLPAGLATLLAGWMLAQRNPAALWVYAGLVLVTLLWSLWEAGLDWWPLAARGDVFFVLGMLLLTPWVSRGLVSPSQRGPRRALGVTLAAFLAVAVASWFHDAHDVPGAFAAHAAPTPTTTVPAAAGGPGDNSAIPPGEWHAYGRTGEGQRYSPLGQITPDNVRGLEVAWQYRTGDVRGEPGDPQETTFEVTPLKVGNRLYLCTPHQSVIALDATTGAQVWRYDTQVQGKGELALQHLTCRGLSYQPPEPAAAGATTVPTAAPAPSSPPAAKPATPVPASAPALPTASCEGRLFMPTADGRLLALDPRTGGLCTDFGNGTGQIDLWTGMPNRRPGAYYSTSPAVVTRDLVIIGGTVLDNASTKEQSGVIRAYDVHTGALVWNWDSAKPEATAPIGPGETYTANSPNSWSISSVDETLGLVYVPMGNQPPDQWGGRRSPEVERYSSSVVALELATGRVRWHFQTVHHDLWDYDVPAQPSLVDLTVKGERVPALVQPTKQGEVFVLDRRTGTPILPVTEVPAPQGAAEGDRTAPTQPKSALSFDPAPLTGADMWGVTLFDQLMCRIAFEKLRFEGRFTPPSTRGTLVYPGNFGVFNWGGVAVDPQREMAFTTPTYLAFTSQLIPRTDDTTLLVQPGGAPPHGMLPALNENVGAPFAVRLKPFVSVLGIPCQAPPWGYVAGADLTTGKIVWKHKNGTVRDLAPVPVPFKMGVPNLGGPVTTAGGVAFLSGTLDYYVRAYDVSNGNELWKSRLPAGGQATPMTYTGADGRQYLVVAAGGHGSLGTRTGDWLIAYALPRT
ncbi:glucose/quinate/shikimate family membrane-bound PQQ-dependent dehydrogenase [Acidovorax sp. SUPP2522]|uniref:glucose/quinate/shikimate family membrane-bound PQQ-dependent dehydrogenase n=1 Tax=unclassified Acidovorax TaxID=2684926 RepID=UPI00234BC4F5|nr:MULTISPECIES: glucose/quinate/shikimate family membrane-bound PQQ-dependent dehydrogenase [unclassified Acidovorax]WCM96922.1 glucose/quinate/shikimate family membrane-bound PQQ-dependent dehydrogenase [Acidovorax sp. GBBC 1281]GKT15282.1 glucose/quinate/shikimate family membrane-bound PQQ-dependent dehydrogenase [Acidovorax sp. SUPP2522]